MLKSPTLLQVPEEREGRDIKLREDLRTGCMYKAPNTLLPPPRPSQRAPLSLGEGRRGGYHLLSYSQRADCADLLLTGSQEKMGSPITVFVRSPPEQLEEKHQE